MTHIHRDPHTLSGESFDIIIVGGGVYGAMALLEATRAGLRTLLLERDDFGSATSSNHFRIGHGGLRYLQSLDLSRFRESVRERRWLIRTFPQLVIPLRCVMPLYGKGLRRPAVMRIALWMNDLLSVDRNWGVRPDRTLERGSVIGSSETLQLFPNLPPDGLEGAAVWYDTAWKHSNRILIEVLRWACEYGAHAQNYVEVKDVIVQNNSASGVVAVDRETGRECVYHASVVVNATGPSSRSFARRIDRDYPELFRKSRAWNVVFDRPPVGAGALAVRSLERHKQTYFLQARGEKLFVGTGHAPCGSAEKAPFPSEEQLCAFIGDLNAALPDLDVSIQDVTRVYAGFLPVEEEQSVHLTDRPIVIDHGRRGSVERLFSVSGVKYTTARHVADVLVSRIQDRFFPKAGQPLFAYDGPRFVRSDYRVSEAGDNWRQACETIIEEESVQHLDDLFLRRTDLGDYPDIACATAESIADLFQWTPQRREEELGRLALQLAIDRSRSEAV